MVYDLEIELRIGRVPDSSVAVEISEVRSSIRYCPSRPYKGGGIGPRLACYTPANSLNAQRHSVIQLFNYSVVQLFSHCSSQLTRIPRRWQPARIRTRRRLSGHPLYPRLRSLLFGTPLEQVRSLLEPWRWRRI